MGRLSPSFSACKAVSKLSSQQKSHNKPLDTLPEVVLRRALRRAGLRFRKNVVGLPGKPDIVFNTVRVVIFCDGDFWHGRNWRSLKSKLKHGANASYWIAKIAYNRKRDRRNVALLVKAGWHVVRVWETDIKKDPLSVAASVKAIVDERMKSTGQSLQGDHKE